MRQVLTIFFAVLFLPYLNGAKLTSDTKKPNIIVMLVDDAGYADFGFAGSKDLKTPNLDRLAANGIIFTDAHVPASVCGPSRAGVLAGRYQQRFGFECNPSPDFPGIDLSETTIANAMQQAGYKTAAFGKWHMGNDPQYRPNARGFDYFWGFLAGSRNYFPSNYKGKARETHAIRENDKITTFDGYLTDCLGEKAVEFIGENKDHPFFMYWAPNAVHTPMQASKEDLVMFEGHPRQTLAAMTWALDRAIGDIVHKLEEEKLLDNTLIFFLSDNGGAHNNESINTPLKGFKGNKYEGGHRVQFVMHWPNELEPSTFSGLSSALDIYATSIAVTGEAIRTNKPLDGVNLMPYLKKEKEGSPHQQLFWRKGEAAAMRDADFKLIRVDNLGYRMYDLSNNLGEDNDVSLQNKSKFRSMQADLQKWEMGLVDPLCTEGAEWDTITWMIHEDLFLNREVRVKAIRQLNVWKGKQ